MLLGLWGEEPSEMSQGAMAKEELVGDIDIAGGSDNVICCSGQKHRRKCGRGDDRQQFRRTLWKMLQEKWQYDTS